MTIRAISSGGGVQSTALLVLQAEGRIDFPLFIMANVGDRAENPDTLDYVRRHALPYAEAHGVELVERRWVTRKGVERDLYDDLLEQARAVNVPVRLPSGAFGTRLCTRRYKIEVVARELKARGATPADPAVLGLGISTDEVQRAKVGIPSEQPWTTRVNPLLDLNLSRRDCLRIVHDAGLPTPPKSSCSFCPFQRLSQWREQRAKHPDLFERNCELDAKLRARHEELGRGPAGLLHASLPLAVAVEKHDDQLQLELGDCEGGYCMT